MLFTEKKYETDIEHCINTLSSGGIILYPTDTIWGLGCDATNAEAADKIIQLKKRPEQKSFAVLVSSEREVLKYVATPDPAVFDYLEKVTHPTTVIYENALGLAENVLAADGSVAIRICKDDFCRHLIKRFRKPIVSTSANVSGDPSPRIFKEISNAITNGADYVVNYRQTEEEPAAASSIIKWGKDGPIIIR